MIKKTTAKDIEYKKIIICILVILCVFFLLEKELFLLINHLIFFSQNILKLYLLLKALASKYHGIFIKRYSDIELKKYSILIPLYKEKDGINQIINAMKNLNYPDHLKEVKLVIEQDDSLTLASARKAAHPRYFEIIEVPYSIPRTKPKALNYAMKYISGEYLVIYDAEDEPDPNQLIDASNIFANSEKNLTCLQAKLGFRNNKKNLLTHFFEIEYRIWFHYLLPAIDMLDLPVPLGGNSNHFKVKELHQIGLWDSYNVTEDADLGIRIYKYNFRTKIMNSRTLEEAPFEISNWLCQRSRWIKGFLQTFFVFLSNKQSSKLNFSQRIFITTFLGFSTYSFLILPFYFINFDRSILAFLNLIIFLIYMYLSVYVACQKKYLTALIWPLYFILHIVASYIALYQLFFKPFKWNKTKHYFGRK